MAGAMVGRVEEAGHLGGAELGPMAAAVCSSGWGTVGEAAPGLSSRKRSRSRCRSLVQLKGCHSSRNGEKTQALRAAGVPVPAPPHHVAGNQDAALYPNTVPVFGAQGRCH